MKNPFHFALYGCGARTQALIDSVIDNNVIVTCCYDINAQLANEVAEKYSCNCVNSEKQLLEYDDVDGYLISLAPKYHADAAMAVAETGKPIYLEKPIATSFSKGKTLASKIRQKNILCYVGFIHRFVPVFSKVTEIIREGTLGQIVAINNNWLCWPHQVLLEESGDWRGDPETGGQLVYHYCHFFDLLRIWGGEFKSLIASSNHLIHPTSPGENEIFVTFSYNSGALANCQFSEASRRGGHFGRIEGSKATLEYEWSKNSCIKIYKSIPAQKEPDIILDIEQAASSNREMMLKFIDAVHSKTKLDITIDEGLITLEIAEAIRKSAKTGKRVSF